MGFPIRKFPDQSLFAAPRDLSQRTTSFIASQRQGIHRTPLRHLIALIANARRSVRLVPLPQALARANEPKRPDSTRQSTGPRILKTGPGTGVGLFEKTSFASNASGSLSGQARLTTGLDQHREMKDDESLAARLFRPGRSTECVSSSQCQIVIARPLSAPQTAFSKEPVPAPPADRQTVSSSKEDPAFPSSGGARRDRTDDLMLAKHALSQLSYGPIGVCGPSGPRTLASARRRLRG